MRRIFVKFLENRIKSDNSILVISADLGYGMFDSIRDKYPTNFINCGASEQLMIGLCIGAAYSGKKPIAYSITPFLLYRPFELIRNYINREKLNIKLVGAGRDKDYLDDGFSHWAEDDSIIMNSFKNIKSYWPEITDIDRTLSLVFDSYEPCYINLRR